MAKCDRGWTFCEDCVNSQGDPDECATCDDGSNYEGFDETEELSVHDLKFIRFKVKEAA